MTELEIRDILERDTDQLLALWRATWTSTYASSLGFEALAGMLDELERNGVSGMLPGNDERGLCAASDGKIMGSVIVAERGRKAYIWGLYVMPECQRSGLGTKLLMAAVEALAPEIKIEVRVLLTSIPATFFYRKHGFVEIDSERTELPGNVSVSTAVMNAFVRDIRH
jgi:ribosomal protein S18 acetylase RimI-like enzyme